MSPRSRIAGQSDIISARRVALRGYAGRHVVLPVSIPMYRDLVYCGHAEMWFVMTCCLAALAARTSDRNGWPRWALEMTDGVSHPWPTPSSAMDLVRGASRAGDSDWCDSVFVSKGSWVRVCPPGYVFDHRTIVDSNGRFLKSLTMP